MRVATVAAWRPPPQGGWGGTLHASAALALRVLGLLALLCVFACAARAQIAVPPLTGRVVDQTGALSPSDIAALTQKLKVLEDRKGSQIAVLLVPTTQPESIEQFSMRVAEAWKIGRKKVDDGAILVIAMNDRRQRIEVGYGLEGALTDVTAHRIIDEVIAPRFKAGDVAGGINAGIDRMIGVIDGEPLPAPASAPRQGQGQGGHSVNRFSFSPALLVVLAIALRRWLGRLVGALATAGISGGLVWLMTASMPTTLGVGILALILALFAGAFAVPLSATRYPGGSGLWGGGFGGGGFGGGGGGGGGFSGGGGGFGGGGASGGW